MAISKKKTEAAAKEQKVSYDVKVTRVYEFKSGDISIDMEVNGVNIYGCTYVNAKPEKNIKESFISFPARKGSDGKYYNLAWFKIDDNLFGDIEKQIEAML